jgi:hypothetical protein
VRFQLTVYGFVFGAVAVVTGGYGTYSNAMHWVFGHTTTASVIERNTECTVEYQIAGEERQKLPMLCDAAEAFQARVGSTRVRVTRKGFAVLEFTTDGGLRQARVSEIEWGAVNLPLHGKIPITYAKSDTNDVRPADALGTSLFVFVGGLLLLSFSLLGKVINFVRSIANKTSSSANSTAATFHLNEPAAAIANPSSQRAAVVTERHVPAQKKYAAVQTHFGKRV